MKINQYKREEKVLRYFNRIKPWMTIIIAMIVIVNIGFNSYIFLVEDIDITYLVLTIAIAVFTIMLTVFLITKPRNMKLSDDDYQMLVQSDYQDLLNNYILKHKEQMINNPIVSYSLCRYPSCKENDFRFSKKNKLWFATHSKYNALIFTEKGIIIYTININHITGNKSYINFEEGFYNKISNVNYKTRIEVIDKKPHDILDLNIILDNGKNLVFNLRNSWNKPKKMNIAYLLYLYLFNHLWIMVSLNNLFMAILFVILYFTFKVGLLYSVLGSLSILLIWVVLMFVNINKNISIEPSEITEEEKNIINKIVNNINEQII